MKTSLASGALVFSVLALTSYACSSSSSTGGGTGGDTDAGTGSSTQDSGGGTAQDSGGPAQNACGTGSFTCNGNAGAMQCTIATQYCQDGLGCIQYIGNDPCPTCANINAECGVDKTLSCAGNDQSGVTATCN